MQTENTGLPEVLPSKSRLPEAKIAGKRAHTQTSLGMSVGSCLHETKKYWNIILLINATILIVRILWVVFGKVPLNSEEAQYWLWSKHPDWSYYSKPPLIAWSIYLFTSLFGDSELGIRIIAIITGFITPLLTYRLAEETLKDSKTAFYSALILFTLPHYHYASLILSTDSLVIMFWLATMLFSWRALQHNRPVDWIISGITLGLGIMSKYTMLLWIPSLLLICWNMKINIFRNRFFYISMVLAAVICTPILIWNVSQGFVGFRHVFGLMGAYHGKFNAGRSIAKVLEYIAGQLGSLVPFYLPALFILLRNQYRKKLGSESKAVDFLMIPFLFVLSFFIIIALRKIEINWTYFAYGSYPILLALAFRKFISPCKMKLAMGSTSLVVLFVLFAPLADRIGLKSPIPPQIDPFHKMSMYDDLGRVVSQLTKEKGDERLFIFSDSYHTAAELAFYTEGNPQTYCINNERRMNQFDLWPGIEQFENKNYSGIYVTSNPLPDSVNNAFEKSELAGTSVRDYRGKKIKKDFHIYYMQGFKSLEKGSFSTF